MAKMVLSKWGGRGQYIAKLAQDYYGSGPDIGTTLYFYAGNIKKAAAALATMCNISAADVEILGGTHEQQ